MYMTRNCSPITVHLFAELSCDCFVRWTIFIQMLFWFQFLAWIHNLLLHSIDISNMYFFMFTPTFFNCNMYCKLVNLWEIIPSYTPAYNIITMNKIFFFTKIDAIQAKFIRPQFYADKSGWPCTYKLFLGALFTIFQLPIFTSSFFVSK